MWLTEDQIKILEKYNINYNFKTIEELLRNMDLVMTDYLVIYDKIKLRVNKKTA